MEKNIIVAIAENNAIGKDNALLWHISEDLRYFKKVTTGGTVVMGRKTFQSIGKALPGRDNIVVTRGDGAGLPEGVSVANSLAEAFSIAESYGHPCFVIGGGEIYRQAMEHVDRIYMTRVGIAVEDADTFFPEIDPAVWRLGSASSQMTDEESGLKFRFLVYEKN